MIITFGGSMRLYIMILSIVFFMFDLKAYADSMQSDKIHTTFNQLRADNLKILDEFYAPDVRFIDPIGEHAGLDSVKKYYQNLYENVDSIVFEKMQHVQEGNKHAYFWRMKLKTPSINNGEEFSVEGMSHITFNEQNLVSYHRDYFDMGEFVYQRVPVLGWVIQKIKKRSNE